MKNVTLDGTTVLQLDADGMDGALDAAADCDVLRNDAAFDLCAIADQKIRGAQLAFDPAKHVRWTIAFDIADDRHAEPMHEAGPVFVVRSGFGANCSTTKRCACSMTSAALAATPLSCPGALLLKLFNMSTSPFRGMTVRCEADIPIIGPVFA